MHECLICHYRFEDEVPLSRHINEGRGCPEED